MTSEKNKPLGTVTNGSTPKDCCDDLDVDVFAVVSSVIAEKLLPCGICVIEAVVPLSLHTVKCCRELLEKISSEFEERGRRREVIAGGPPVAAASGLSPELWLSMINDDAVKLHERH